MEKIKIISFLWVFVLLGCFSSSNIESNAAYPYTEDVYLQSSTPENFKVAFIADQGLGDSSRAVLELIKGEGTDIVLHQGDFDYEDNPDLWDEQISDILGLDFPYFASAGNHDMDKWGIYQQKLQERLSRIDGVVCGGNLGIKSVCKYKGFFFLLIAPGITGEGYGSYTRDQLAKDNSMWSICSWHKNQTLMQVGGKEDKAGWGAYRECRKGGGFIVTGHSHSYSRTHLMDNFQDQVVSSTSDILELEPGKSFAVVSGLGGKSIRSQKLDGAWWASVYTKSQGADYGALFCTFTFNGDPNRARCYFKDISGVVLDTFDIVSKNP